MWGPGGPLVVIGHRRPDLDSIAAALGYAALLVEQGRSAVARRAGPLDDQTLWAMARFGLAAPPLLVDHNELDQALPGADQAEIVEVLDHHRLGNPTTTLPIRFSVDIVGSTSTLVEERWRGCIGRPPAALAGGLLSAILSDTLAFRSPTCTPRDRQAAERLARDCGISDLEGFGREVVVAGAGLGDRSADAIVEEDCKEFDSAQGRLLVAQVEVHQLAEVRERADELSAALERLRGQRGAALALLMVTDPLRGISRLLCRGEHRLLARLPWPRAADGLHDAGALVSRKTELLPALLGALSD